MTLDARNVAVDTPAIDTPCERSFPVAYPHLHPSAALLVTASNSEKAAHILKHRWIRYPAMTYFHEQAQWMILEPRQSRARGIICCARPGNGKSSLADWIASQYCASDDGKRACAVKVSLEGCPDARTMYGRIMDELGSPARVSHRLGDRENIVIRLLRAASCRLLLLDEVQDLALGTRREQQKSMEGIKFVMNRLRMPVLAFGTDEAGTAFMADAHLAARFTQTNLPLWNCDEILRNFVATYETCLPFERPSDLSDVPKLELLARTSAGVLDLIVKRIQNAALLALSEGRDCIDLNVLDRAAQRPASCFIQR